MRKGNIIAMIITTIIMFSLLIITSCVEMPYKALTGKAYETVCGQEINHSIIMNNDLQDCVGNGLIITADNVVLDCDGHWITGDGSGDTDFGVYVNNHHNVVVRNCNIEGFEDGVRINHSSFVSVFGGEVRNNSWRGVFIKQESYNITLQGLNVHNVKTGVDVYDNSYNVVIEGSSFSNNSENGIVLGSETHDNILINNTVSNNNDYGIYLFISDNNFLSNNTVNNNNKGISLLSSYNNFLSNNTVSNNNDDGIHLYSSDSNVFDSNVVFGNNENGFTITGLDGSDFNVFKNNLVFDNGKGVGVDHGHDNLFFNNVFNNSLNYNFSNNVGFNSWNNSFTGNLWLKPDGGGYSQTCGDNDNNGFCDEPYVLNENNIDYKPIVAGAGFVDVNPPSIVIYSPIGIVNNVFDLSFNVTDSSGVNVSSLAYSIDNHELVHVGEGNCSPITNGYSCLIIGLTADVGSHNLTVYASDLMNNQGNSTTNFEVVSGGLIGCGYEVTDSMVLSNNIENCPGHGLIIGADNITLNCDGHWITGVGEGDGVHISMVSNITIKNCFIKGFNNGVFAEGEPSGNTANAMLINNTILNSLYYGVQIYNYDNVTIISNNISNSSVGVYVDVPGYDLEIINSSITNSKGFDVFSLESPVYVENTLGTSGNSIRAFSNQQVNIEGGTYSELLLYNVSGAISNTEILGPGNGLLIAYSHNLEVSNSKLYGCYKCLYLHRVTNSSFYKNSLSTNNTLYIDSSNNNTFYDNDFRINNESLVYLWHSVNYWNSSFGNLWINDYGTGFSQTCQNIDNDSFCDENLTLNDENIDYKPLKARQPPCGNYGDVDFDGVITRFDVWLVFDYVVGKTQLTNEQLLRADVDGDGSVSVYDGSLILQYREFENNTFPVCEQQTISCGDTLTQDTTLTANLSNCSGHGLIITADNITLDCAGHWITGDGSGDSDFGVYVNNHHNVVVRDCNIEGFEDGVRINHSSFVSVFGGEIRNNSWRGVFIKQESYNITLQGLNVHNVKTGVDVYDSSYNVVIMGSSFSDNSENGIVLGSGTHDNILINNTASNNNDYGIHLYSSDNNFLSNNTANNNNDYGIYLYGSDNNFLVNNTASNNGYKGILLDGHSDNNIIDHNVVVDNVERGIHIYGGSGNVVSNNVVSGNSDGIMLDQYSVDNNVVVNNSVIGNRRYGVSLYNSDSNVFDSNVVFDNGGGFGIGGDSGSDFNVFKNNLVFGNGEGVGVDHGHDNLFYNNVFNNNLNYNFSDNVGFNSWNFSVGNFWGLLNGTGFSQTCNDSDNDGFCDEPYVLAVSNTDYKPLVNYSLNSFLRFNRSPPCDGFGDIDFDGVVSFADVLMVEQYLAGGLSLNGSQLSRADVSGDDSVDALDVGLMARYLVNIITSFPICNPQPFCGDGVCNNGETCHTCPVDCGSCPNNHHGGGHHGGTYYGAGTFPSSNCSNGTFYTISPHDGSCRIFNNSCDIPLGWQVVDYCEIAELNEPAPITTTQTQNQQPSREQTVCSNNEKRCSKDILYECKNNKWVLLQNCSYGCEGNACKQKTTRFGFKYILGVFGLILILGVVTLTHFHILKRFTITKHKQAVSESKKLLDYTDSLLSIIPSVRAFAINHNDKPLLELVDYLVSTVNNAKNLISIGKLQEANHVLKSAYDLYTSFVREKYGGFNTNN